MFIILPALILLFVLSIVRLIIKGTITLTILSTLGIIAVIVIALLT